MWPQGGAVATPIERAVRSPQSRHRKRQLFESMQHVSLPSERLVVENLAAQVSASRCINQMEAVNVCVHVLRNVKNSVYVRALGARGLGLLMLESQALTDRLQLETEGLVDALLQLIGYCRRCHTSTSDLRRVHVNCCLVISLLMQAPLQQQHLQLVVSLDSDLLVLPSQPTERASAKLLLTVAGRPDSGDLLQVTTTIEGDSVLSSTDCIVPTLDKKTKQRKRRAHCRPSLFPATAASKNQHSSMPQDDPKGAWSGHDSEFMSKRGHVTAQLPATDHDTSSSNDRRTTRTAAESLASDIARRETPYRDFKMERYGVMTPAFPRQNVLDPLLMPLPIIQPTGGHQMLGQVTRLDEETSDQRSRPLQPHVVSDTLLHPKQMLHVLRTHHMPLVSRAYFQKHLRDGDQNNVRNKGDHSSVPSRLQVVQWDQWNKEHQNDEDDREHEAATAVATIRRPPLDDVSLESAKAMPQASEAPTPALKRQRLREILSPPTNSNEQSVRQLRALAQRANTSVMTSLESAATRARNEEFCARQELHSMIQEEHARLPLKFLFQLPGGAAYCRHRMRRAMALWVLEFEDNQRRMALMQWKAIVEQARFVERGQGYHRQAIQRRLGAAIAYVVRSYQRQGLWKWIETTQMLIWSSRDTAARLIQVTIRRHLTRQWLLALHRRHPFANPLLRDISLSPARTGLPFQIPFEVRDHRRKLWHAADIVQSAYRYRRFRVALARYRAASTKIQSLQRMRAARSRYRRVQSQIVLIQARVRMRLCRATFLTLRNAALLVQAVYRSVRIRRLRRLVRCSQRKETERVLSSTALLQRIARGFLGRVIARNYRRSHEEEWHAALIFQRCWYRHNNEWSTFLLLGCLREKEKEEREFHAQVLSFKRRHMAQVLRRTWLTYRALKRDKAAKLIQRNARQLLAKRLVGLMRRQKMARRRIKWFCRLRHAARVRTARYLQFWWLQAVPGRLQRHLLRRRMTEKAEARRCKFEREDHASCCIQALVRGHFGRQLALCERSACVIQRAIRVHLMRKHFKEEFVRLRALVSRCAVEEWVNRAQERVVGSIMRLLHSSAREIQRIFRGVHCRMCVMRSIVDMELRGRMATRIQLKWRQNAHQRVAQKLLQAQKRKQLNPFRMETSMSVIIAKMLTLSSMLYDPDDELRGMSAYEWLRRLGLGPKYSKVFHGNPWVSFDPVVALKQLRELDRDECDEKLQSIGIDGFEDRQVMLTNLFAFQTIQDTKQQRKALASGREKQTQLKRSNEIAQMHLQTCVHTQHKYEKALEEVLHEALEFRHPPKAVRERQAACARELEDAATRTVQARRKCESSAMLQAAQMCEMTALQQQLTCRQEPKEVSATHSLHYLRPIDELHVVRDLFLERFPGLGTRAVAFVSALEANQVTRWQLQRFFETYTAVSEVKAHLKDLTFFPFETEVKRSDHVRWSQCADILQYGHERLAEMLEMSVALDVGKEATVVPGSSHFLLDQTLLVTMAACQNARGNQEKAQSWRTGADAIARMNASALKMQSFWRQRLGRKIVAELRVTRRHGQVRDQYIAEFHADHVTPIWMLERRKEQEALSAWLEMKAKAHRLSRLYETLRYPYVEEWDDEAQAYVYALYSRTPTASIAAHGKEQTQLRSFVRDKPTYTIEEEDVVIRLQAHMRRYLAQRHVRSLIRLHGRQCQRAALEREWNKASQERVQLVTLKLELHSRRNGHMKTWWKKQVKLKPSLQSHPNTTSPLRAKHVKKPLKVRHPVKSLIGKNQNDDNAAQEQDRHGSHLRLPALIDALAPIYHSSVRAENQRDWSFPASSRPDNAHGRAIVHLLDQLSAFYKQTSSKVQVVTSLRYTKVALRFGWVEVPGQAAASTLNSSVKPQSYYMNKKTLETSWERPAYSFDEHFAALRLQAHTRTLLAIKTREKKVAAISLVSTIGNAIKQAAQIGWVGYALEGMTSAVFLSRLGLTKHIVSALGKAPLEELLAIVSSEEKAKSLGWSKEEAAVVPLFPRILKCKLPQSCRRETSVQAREKHPFNILPSERIVLKLLTQSFPHEQGRVANLLRALQCSTTPISYRQLEGHLRRYAGRPDDAIANVKEIASLAYATREPQEKSIFVLYRQCAERCVVFAANLRLSTLQWQLSAALRMPQRLLPRGSQSNDAKDAMATTATTSAIPFVSISLKEEDKWLQKALARYPRCTVKGLWENDVQTSFSYAQMALYLREEVLERVLAWERAALLCQALFRMFRVRRWYRAILAARADAATVIQCAWRSLDARQVRALFKSQQQSPYEQRVDKRTGTLYFVYVPTDEKLLEEPCDEVTGGVLPFRPMIQDRLTNRWMLAWPHYSPAARQSHTSNVSLEAQTPWLACSLCVVERAARRCDECYSRTGDYVNFCLACFYDRHFPTASLNSTEDLSWHTYTALSPLTTSFFRCVECSRPSVLRCLPCNEHYCERCFTRVHARGKTRSRHAHEWYAPHSIACVECEMTVACQRCLTCQDALCETCMARTHARGRRADSRVHTIELLPQPLESGEVYCEQCHVRRGDERCEFCAQTLCAVCHWTSLSPLGARSSRHALVCVETALVEKRRELLGDRGLCVECDKAADRECVTCGDSYCSVRWMGNPGCFERFHRKGKRSDHTFTMLQEPFKVPHELVVLEKLVQAKRRQDAETAEHEAKRMAAALLEEKAEAIAEKKSSTTQQKTIKKNKKRLAMGAADGRKRCAVLQCRRRALVLELSGPSVCAKHFTLQHALEAAGKDPREAARLLALVENGGGRAVKLSKRGWREFFSSKLFSRGQSETSDVGREIKEEV